ncbi:MAG: hypothetical protein AABY75_03330, partial [Bacteroidota bacterium]
MPLSVRVDLAKNRVFIDASGTLVLEDALRLLDDLSMAGPEICGRGGIIDSSRVTGTTLSFDSIRQISEHVTHIEELFRGTRWAVVAPGDVMFGIARMYETLRSGSSF